MKFGAGIFLIVLSTIIVSPTAWAFQNAVVKVYTSYNGYDYKEPWQKKGPQTCTGSGCIISGKKILTNAHVVADQSFIQVSKVGDQRKYIAEVEAVSHECDLAILRVKDEEFFVGVIPIEIGNPAQLLDRVVVYGYPKGGENVFATEAQISRIEHTMYEHRHTNLLTYQLNVPIKNGNSGGPVLKDNRLVGVAFESGVNEDNKDVGLIIPTPVINQFLADIADGKHDGIPSLGITLQAIENPDLKLKLGMAENQSGDLVIKIDPDSPAKGILKQSDVILSIKHKAIVGDKTVEFPEIIAASSLDTIKRSQINDTVIIQILRNKTIMHTKVRLSEPWPISKLVSPEQYDIEPTYFIFGGLVFEPLTVNFLKTWGSNWLLEAPSNLLNYLLYGKRRYNRKEIIVLVKVLSDEINVSYEGFEDCVISSVNNKQISTMRDLVKAFQEHRGEYHTITDEFGHKIVLDRKKVNRRGKKILKKYGIGSDRSSDLEQTPVTMQGLLLDSIKVIKNSRSTSRTIGSDE